MDGHLGYRSSRAEISSSSPLQNLQSLSSSPPLSPGSPTPAHRTTSRSSVIRQGQALASPSSSHTDPFSGSAKALPSSHPSFGKGQLRLKHLRNSPNVKSKQDNVAVLSEAIEPLYQRQRDNVLEQHFLDSSDDNPTSDDPSIWSQSHATALPSSQSSIHALHGAQLGLGIQDLTEREQNTSLLAAPFIDSTPSQNKGTRVRTFSRAQSSSKDPFSAGSGSSIFAPATEHESPRAHHTSQRRRLTGSSPKKLSRARKRILGEDIDMVDSEDSAEDGVSAWNQYTRSPRANECTSVSWQAEVNKVFEKVDGKIELVDRNISSMDPIVADLAKFVNLPPLRNDKVPSSTLPRTLSTTGIDRVSHSAAGSTNTSPTKSHLRRSTSNFITSKLELYLAKNSLKTYPSALFEVTNIVVLSLRENGIRELPPAIGHLRNLRELNVAQNALKYLPAEIQRLQLDKFTFFPNPFQRAPEEARLSSRPFFCSIVRAKATTLPPQSMGPPPIPARARHAQHASTDSEMMARYLEPMSDNPPSLPTLVEYCMRRLLEVEGSDNDHSSHQILLQNYEAGCLSALRHNLNRTIIRNLEAARRSAAGVWGRTRPGSGATEETWCTGARPVLEKAHKASVLSAAPHSYHQVDRQDDGEASAEWSSEEDDRLELLDVEKDLDRGDDSCQNPWFNQCPNPDHQSLTLQPQELISDWPLLDEHQLPSHTFVQPTSTRLEWVSHVGGYRVAQSHVSFAMSGKDQEKPLVRDSDCLPIRWRGCGLHCLDFLHDQ